MLGKYSSERRITMKQVAEMAVQFMAASARTAPKKIANAMKEYAPKSTNEAFWNRDAANIENSQALLLIGLSKPVTAGYDCGACGYPTCNEFSKSKQMKAKEMGYTGPHCVMRMMDIGVALSSAAKTASIHNVDNRVQQRVGAAARALGLIQAEVAMGIPISIGGKSIYFDRQAPAKH
jgi:uncharacterized ferredoxin-like protein